MRELREADIEEAKAYLRLRLEVEHSMQYNLEIIMREAAERVVDILYTANVSVEQLQFNDIPMRVQWDINAVIDWLKETIDDYFLALAIYDHEDNKDKILPFILGVNHSQTFEERLTDYCSKYRDELLLLVGAGLFLGLGQSTLAKSIGDHLKQPYKNPDLAEGIAAPLSYGRGRSNSMYNAIGSLTRFGIAQAWMKDWELTTEAKGAIGWEVRRGSTYSCSQCDDNCGFHPLDEGTDLPQHNSCCCFAIPIYKESDIV